MWLWPKPWTRGARRSSWTSRSSQPMTWRKATKPGKRESTWGTKWEKEMTGRSPRCRSTQSSVPSLSARKKSATQSSRLDAQPGQGHAQAPSKYSSKPAWLAPSARLYQEKSGTTSASPTNAGDVWTPSSSQSCKMRKSLSTESAGGGRDGDSSPPVSPVRAAPRASSMTQSSWFPGAKKTCLNLARKMQSAAASASRFVATSPATMTASPGRGAKSSSHRPFSGASTWTSEMSQMRFESESWAPRRDAVAAS
mmetsp:Transcript_22232/g.76590  ORF Transcript_22232/g.76590 Transcript_22232/m.76590 type:complete len:253 (-) Transcript_22232:170-928(-)